MKKIRITRATENTYGTVLLGAVLFIALVAEAAPCVGAEPPPALIPAPKQVSWKEGRFTLGETAMIVIPPNSAGDVKYAADALVRALSETAGCTLQISEESPAVGRKGNIVLHPAANDAELGSEGYRLSIDEGVLLEARDGRGLFYGIQTLRQMVRKNDGVSIARAEIRDRPSWEYRGVMLDPARNYMTMEFLKRQIDVLSSYKLNYFHLHLTDTEGWRPEIKAYPQLASEKHYTQEQLKELVAYAKARFVTLVPEIEMPGHCDAFLAKMPNLGHNRVMCVGNEKLYETMETLWSEMAAIFDGPYLHVGGDECNDDLTCPLCKAKWEELRKNPDSPGTLIAYFLNRMNEIVKGLDRQMVAWTVDERFWSGVLPQDVVVMSWTSDPLKHARRGYRTIDTRTKPLYFDHQHPIQAFLDWWPDKRLAVNLLTGESLPGNGDSAEETLPTLLGAEGEAWHDRPVTHEWSILLDLAFYPRLMALAQQVWGPPTGANGVGLAEFESRLLDHKTRFFSRNTFPEHLPMK